MSDADVDTVLKEATDILSNRFNVRLHIHGRKVVQVPEDRLDVTACDASQLFSSDAIDLTGDAGGGSFGDLFGCGDNLLDVGTELIHDVLDIIFIRDIIERRRYRMPHPRYRLRHHRPNQLGHGAGARDRSCGRPLACFGHHQPDESLHRGR